MKKVKRFFLLLFIVFLLTIGIFAGLGFVPRSKDFPPPSPDRRFIVYVVSHGYHTGLILPDKIREYAWPELVPGKNDVLWYEFGWGDREYYRIPEPDWKVTANALFVPSPTTMHVTAINMKPELWAGDSDLIRLEVSEEQFAEVSRHVRDGFEGQPGENYIGKGIYGSSAFYEGTGKYHLLKNCNAWTAEGLRKMGYPTPVWSGIAPGVMRVLKKSPD